MTKDVMVGPDPLVQITQRDRTAQHAAVMSAYALQEQLGSAREAAQALSIQLTPIRQYLNTAGDGGKSALQILDKVSPEITRLQGEIGRTLQMAARAQSAIDAYPGVPTAAQTRDLDWAWDDAAKSVTDLNRILHDEMAGVYSALAPGAAWKEIAPVAVPERTK